MNNSKKFYIILILSVLFANTAVIFTRNALSYGGMPIIIGFYRLSFSALIMVPFVFYRQRNQSLDLKWHNLKYCLLGGIFMALHFFCYFSSLMYTNGFISTITGALQPITIAIASYFLFKEKINKKGINAMIIAILGLVFIGIFTLLSSKEGGSFIGFVISLFTALFFCAYLLCSKKALKDIEEYTFLFILFSVCSIVLGLIAIITKTPFTGYPKEMYLNCFGLCIFCTMLGHAIFNIAVKYVSATTVSVINLLGPIFAAFYDYIIFSQRIFYYQIIGGIIIFIGVYIFLKSKAVNSQTQSE